MPPKEGAKADSKDKPKKSGAKGKAVVKKPPPAPLAPGSQEEVVAFLKEQLQLHKLANPPPGSDPPSASVLDLYKKGTQKLRKSIHDYTEYQTMYVQAARSTVNTSDNIGDAKEQELRDFVVALERAMKKVGEKESSTPEDTSSELLSKEQWEALDDKLTALEKSFLKPFKEFLTKRPQWLPEDRMILDGCDQDFTVCEFGAVKIDDSGLAPMPDIPDSQFHTGRAGNFSKLQNEAAGKRFEGYSLRERLQLERDQLKQKLDDKDRQIEEIDSLKSEVRMP